MDKTTIRVTRDQRDRLEEMKLADREALYEVVGRLLDERDGDVPDDLADVRESLATLEERTGKVERLLEEMQR